MPRCASQQTQAVDVAVSRSRERVVDRKQDIVVAVAADGVATVTLDRPAKRNAVSLAMWNELGDIFPQLGSRQDVSVVILTGAGGHFCRRRHFGILQRP